MTGQLEFGAKVLLYCDQKGRLYTVQPSLDRISYLGRTDTLRHDFSLVELSVGMAPSVYLRLLYSIITTSWKSAGLLSPIDPVPIFRSTRII